MPAAFRWGRGCGVGEYHELSFIELPPRSGCPPHLGAVEPCLVPYVCLCVLDA